MSRNKLTREVSEQLANFHEKNDGSLESAAVVIGALFSNWFVAISDAVKKDSVVIFKNSQVK